MLLPVVSEIVPFGNEQTWNVAHAIVGLVPAAAPAAMVAAVVPLISFPTIPPLAAITAFVLST